MRDDISILDDPQRGGYGRVHRRRASADAASATLPASLSLPLSSSPRLPRSPGGKRTTQGKGEDRLRKRERERENRESDSSPQGRSETMRASIDPLSSLSCRVELTCPGLPSTLSLVAVVLVDARNLPRARNFAARPCSRVTAIAQLKTGRGEDAIPQSVSTLLSWPQLAMDYYGFR